jgi:hypothetical protein
VCVYVRVRVCNFNFYNNVHLALQAMKTTSRRAESRTSS